MTQSQGDAGLRLIKKYPNRRLYDTGISSYITLEDVRQLVLEGENFQVRDARSDADLTRAVLLQIIVEHEERGQSVLSPQLLRDIIRFHDDDSIAFHLERGLQAFLEQNKQDRHTD